MDYKKLKECLLDIKYISDIEIKEINTSREEKYICVIYCKIMVIGQWIPIEICIPKFWQIELFDTYVLKYNLFIPHIDSNHKLCVVNLDSMLIVPEFYGLLGEYILKVRNLLKDGLTEKNKFDFIREFDSYFRLMKKSRESFLSICDKKNNNVIKFSEITNENILKNNEKEIEKEEKVYFVSDNQEYFNMLLQNVVTEKNGLYFYINPNQYIYPPNFFENNILEFLNFLLSFINVKDFITLKSKCKENFIIVFGIQQDETIFNFCGFMINGASFVSQDRIRLVCAKNIYPLNFRRIDSEFLSARTNLVPLNRGTKKIMLIGCGSIGGYIFYNLIKSGYTDIIIIDSDLMKAENIYRHILGFESIGDYKVKSLKKFADRAIPNVNIITIPDKFQEVIEDGKLDLNQVDYIISATGSHTFNRWLNRYILKHQVEKTAFYAWNEPLNIGCHAVRINYKNQGDYEDIFDITSGVTIDKSSYVMQGQVFVKSYYGCGGTYVPYSDALSQKSALLVLDLLRREEEGRLDKNIIISQKEDDYYLKKANFFTSKRYNVQKEKYTEVNIEEL